MFFLIDLQINSIMINAPSNPSVTPINSGSTGVIVEFNIFEVAMMSIPINVDFANTDA